MSQRIIDIHPNDGEGSPDTSEFLFGRSTKGITIAYNLVVNINGNQFPGNYAFNSITDPTGMGYRVKQFQDAYGNAVTDLDVIRNYLKHMTGSNYIPEYNATDPNDVFIYANSPDYIDSERAWKYQYSPMTGLLVFGVDNFPFASKEYVQNYVAQLNAAVVTSDLFTEVIYDQSSQRLTVGIDGLKFPFNLDFSFDFNSTNHAGSVCLKNSSTAVKVDLGGASWSWDPNIDRLLIIYDNISSYDYNFNADLVAIQRS